MNTAAASSKRGFYIVRPPSGYRIHAFLDAIRILANPSTKAPPHVTVAGPTHSQKPLLVKGLRERVSLTGVGTFFHERPDGSEQNTVFFTCHCPWMKEFWDKPDYPRFTPHLTIYDGDDRKFAKYLAALFVENAGPHHEWPSELGFPVHAIELMKKEDVRRIDRSRVPNLQHLLTNSDAPSIEAVISHGPDARIDMIYHLFRAMEDEFA